VPKEAGNGILTLTHSTAGTVQAGEPMTVPEEVALPDGLSTTR
jgi:hypothetical protein